ncbi:MAG: hypothetical protein B7Z69_04780 [Actinobacteria bacterium 21-73-9]|nr:MAG: hypothetical protein B7Z69_04780 [Actinobacteria bacterium 21-73-9]
MAEPVAAVDCGSNSTRLLITDPEGRAMAREMRITRLSEGVDASGELTEVAVARTLAVLEEYHGLCERAGVTRGLCVATSAVRDARNGGAFLARARETLGFDAVVLSGEDEATYSFEGATVDLAEEGRPVAILDVGGGSTEIASRVDGRVLGYSMQIGCVRVTERALGPDPVDAEHATRAVAMIESALEAAAAAAPELFALGPDLRLVGLAGTVSTLAQLDAGLDHYDRAVVHHRRLSREAVLAWRDRLGSEPPAARLGFPGMVAGREDVIVAGLYVVDAVMARLGVDELLSSESDILDGIAGRLRLSFA